MQIGEVANVEISRFLIGETECGEPVAKPLQGSVETYGVAVPVVVESAGSDRLRIVDGYRRLKATILAGNTTIPAIEVIGLNETERAVLRLALHGTRSDSPTQEFREIGLLKRNGVKDLSSLTGFSSQTISKREKLARLPYTYIVGAETGAIAISVLEAIANATPEAQYWLHDIYDKRGTITGPDVKQAISTTAPAQEGPPPYTSKSAENDMVEIIKKLEQHRMQTYPMTYDEWIGIAERAWKRK